MTNVIAEPKELHGFVSTPGIESMNVMFVNDEVVWISWKYGAEKHMPSLRYTNEVVRT